MFIYFSDFILMSEIIGSVIFKGGRSIHSQESPLNYQEEFACPFSLEALIEELFEFP